MSEALANTERIGEIDYSTEEQWTGRRWIDGKKIYIKTIDFGALPNNTTKSVSHNISNLDYVVNKINGFKSSSGQQISAPYAHPTAISGQLKIDIYSDRIAIESKFDFSGFSGYVTLEYTKTTD